MIKLFDVYKRDYKFEIVETGDYIAMDLIHFRTYHKNYITILKVYSSPMSSEHSYYEFECLYKLNNGKLEELEFGDKMRRSYIRMDYSYLVKIKIYSNSNLKNVMDYVYLMDSINKYNL